MEKVIRVPLTDCLPCPLCGQTKSVQVMSRWFFEEMLKPDGEALCDISCENCELSLKAYNQTNYDEALKALTEKWNTRADVGGVQV